MPKIDNLNIDNFLFLAPMAGITDPPFRKIVGNFGGVGLMFSEMIPSKSLFLGNREKSLDKVNSLECYRNNNMPRAVQIAGNDPHYMAEAAKLNVDLGAQLVDINFGCPVKKVVKGFAGAALMKDIPLARKIMESVKKAVNVPVTVKMRLGWDRKHITAPLLAKIAEDVGVAMVTVHARTRSQFYEGKADWKRVAEVKNVVTIPLIVNGDVVDYDSYRQALEESGADGAMIGRAVQGKPWIFREINAQLGGEIFETPTREKLKQIIFGHLALATAYYGEKGVIPLFRKHLNHYSAGLSGSAEFRSRINGIADYGKLQEEIERFFAEG